MIMMDIIAKIIFLIIRWYDGYWNDVIMMDIIEINILKSTTKWYFQLYYKPILLNIYKEMIFIYSVMVLQIYLFTSN